MHSLCLYRQHVCLGCSNLLIHLESAGSDNCLEPLHGRTFGFLKSGCPALPLTNPNKSGDDKALCDEERPNNAAPLSTAAWLHH